MYPNTKRSVDAPRRTQNLRVNPKPLTSGHENAAQVALKMAPKRLPEATASWRTYQTGLESKL